MQRTWRVLLRRVCSTRAHLMCVAEKAGATPLRTARQCPSVLPVSRLGPARNCALARTAALTLVPALAQHATAWLEEGVSLWVQDRVMEVRGRGNVGL